MRIIINARKFDLYLIIHGWYDVICDEFYRPAFRVRFGTKIYNGWRRGWRDARDDMEKGRYKL